MKKVISFKGNISHFDSHKKTNHILLKYQSESVEKEYNNCFSETTLLSFQDLKLNSEEKKLLCRKKRKVLNFYRNLNLFSLKLDANRLITQINSSSLINFKINASDYGAFICLAAIYSGKINKDKKIELTISNAPIALFPSTMIKAKNTSHHINFRKESNCWISPIESLHGHHELPFFKDKKIA